MKPIPPLGAASIANRVTDIADSQVAAAIDIVLMQALAEMREMSRNVERIRTAGHYGFTLDHFCPIENGRAWAEVIDGLDEIIETSPHRGRVDWEAGPPDELGFEQLSPKWSWRRLKILSRYENRVFGVEVFDDHSTSVLIDPHLGTICLVVFNLIEGDQMVSRTEMRFDPMDLQAV